MRFYSFYLSFTLFYTCWVTISGGSGSTAVGGLVGYNTGTVRASSFTGTVSVGTNSFAVGGLAGFNNIDATVSGSGTGGVTAGAGSTYIHGGNQIGDDLNQGGSNTPSQQVVTVTAHADPTTYGTALSALSYTPTGTLESGDTYGSILSGTLTSTAGTDAGTYAIGQGSVALTSPYATLDYTIDYIGANVIINKLPIPFTTSGGQTSNRANENSSSIVNSPNLSQVLIHQIFMPLLTTLVSGQEIDLVTSAQAETILIGDSSTQQTSPICLKSNSFQNKCAALVALRGY